MHTSALDRIDRALAATSRSELIRRCAEALSWAMRRLAHTDAAELLLDILRSARSVSL